MIWTGDPGVGLSWSQLQVWVEVCSRRATTFPSLPSWTTRKGTLVNLIIEILVVPLSVVIWSPSFTQVYCYSFHLNKLRFKHLYSRSWTKDISPTKCVLSKDSLKRYSCRAGQSSVNGTFCYLTKRNVNFKFVPVLIFLQ